MNTTDYSGLDREIVTLASVWDLIRSLVNYAHFEKGHRTHEATLMFRNAETTKLFLILFADFLSLPRSGTLGLAMPTGEGSLGSTYLGLLDTVAANPRLGRDPNTLARPLRAFSSWLDDYTEVEGVWLPSIEWNGPLRVQRKMHLKICGTISKHNFTRLGDIVGKIRRVFADNGAKINEGQAYRVLPEFQEWFQEHIFNYHSTSIACFLNDIRWGIFDYLTPEFRRANAATSRFDCLQMYEYAVPQEVVDPLIRAIYWDLMNEMRQCPYFPRFTVDPYLTRRY